MSGVIYVDDSSDEEIARTTAPIPKKACAGTAKAASLQSKSDDAVVLLDDDESETQQQELQSDAENALFLDQLERAKRESLALLATKSCPNRVYQSLPLNRYVDSDDSDSGDSIFNFPVLRKRGKPTADKENCASSSVAENKCSQSLTASSASSVTFQPIVNPYAKKAPAEAPKSQASSCTATPSSTSSGPIANPYARKNQGQGVAELTSASSGINIDTSATGLNPLIFPIETFQYPKLLDHSKQYPDLRASYLLALWKTARSYTSHSHNRAKLDQAVTKVVALALRPWPLRSLEEFMHRGKKGGPANGGGSAATDNERRERLKMMLEEGGLNSIQVAAGESGAGGRYCSIPEACLVAMYEEIERRRQQKRSEANNTSTTEVSLQEQLASPENWVSLSSLIPAIDERLIPICPGRLWRKNDDDGGVAYYLDKSTRSVEYLQIKKLQLTCPIHTTEIQTGYLKEHNFKKQKVFELTPLGWNTAQWIKRRVFPSAPGHYRTSHIASRDNVPPEYKDICVAVDFREGGVQKNVLHNMLNSLDWKNIPYFVGSLNIGDYAFFWTRPGPHHGKLCPILVERKSVQDIAMSIADGRWSSQKKRMYHGQYTLGYNNCRLAYIIEGHEQTQMVSGGYVGHRRLGVDRERLDEAIKNLGSEGFEVLRSTCTQNSMFELSRFAKAIGEEVREGKLSLQFDFSSFQQQVRQIPRGTDFSRLAKDHMNNKLQQPEAKVPDAVADSVSNSTKQAAPSKPAADIAIDLCSDDGKDDRSAREERPVRVPVVRCNRMGRAAPSSNDSSWSTALNTREVRPQSRFNPSKEVLSYFGKHESSDEDEDEDIQAAMAVLQRCRKSEERRRKRKKAEAEKAANKKRKSVGRPASALKRKAPHKTAAAPDTNTVAQRCNENESVDEYRNLSIAQLQAKCTEVGLVKGGSKENLIERLRGPKPPQVWLDRKSKGEYVPTRHNTGASALLVALYLHERQADENALGLTKPELYVKAEDLGISKNPFSGGTTQTGPYHYDGWANMKQLCKGDPALVKEKHSRYKLTRCGPLAGYSVAKAMHKWCHEQGNCSCGLED